MRQKGSTPPEEKTYYLQRLKKAQKFRIDQGPFGPETGAEVIKVRGYQKALEMQKEYNQKKEK